MLNHKQRRALRRRNRFMSLSDKIINVLNMIDFNNYNYDSQLVTDANNELQWYEFPLDFINNESMRYDYIPGDDVYIEFDFAVSDLIYDDVVYDDRERQRHRRRNQRKHANRKRNQQRRRSVDVVSNVMNDEHTEIVNETLVNESLFNEIINNIAFSESDINAMMNDLIIRDIIIYDANYGDAYNDVNNYVHNEIINEPITNLYNSEFAYDSDSNTTIINTTQSSEPINEFDTDFIINDHITTDSNNSNTPPRQFTITSTDAFTKHQRKKESRKRNRQRKRERTQERQSHQRKRHQRFDRFDRTHFVHA